MAKKNRKPTKSRKPTPKRTPVKTRPARKTTPSTSLAVVKAPRPELVREEDNPALPERRLTAEPLAITVGVVPVKFSKAEEQVLCREVNPSDIRIKPTGVPYVSHPTYTRWLNEAFGRGQWTLVEISTPTKGGTTVLIKYALLVRGVPVAAAYGEQEYFENNKDQSYGDVVESTYASALRRCCKHLGMALEMWERSFLDAWVDDHCLAVKVRAKDGSERTQWRRKVDRQFWNEKGRATQGADDDPRAQRHQAPPPKPVRTAQAHAEAPAAHHPKAGEPITDEQLRRLWTIIRRSDRAEADVKAFLQRYYGIDSSKAIKRRDYENICKSIEHPGPLQPVLDIEARIPGQEV